MQIKIEARVSRGLKIIEDIPDVPICKVEGVNGIGKTSAIRLLQLLTGQQPFANNAGAWSTFRTQLLGARVRLATLAGADSIEWDFVTSSWPKEPRLLEMGDLTIRIDGVPADISDVSEILRVDHFNATQTPQQILARQVAEAAASVDEWYQADGNRRSAQIEQALDSRLRGVDYDPKRIRALKQDSEEANAAAEALAEELTGKQKLANDLQEAVTLTEQLDKFRESIPDLEAEIHELAAGLDTFAQERATLNESIETARKVKRLSEDAEKKFNNAKKNLERRRNAHAAQSAELQKGLAQAGLAAGQVALDEAIRLAGAKLDSLLKTQPYVDTDPLMRDLLQDVISRLDRAIAMDLGALMLIDEEVRSPGWTVLGLRDASSEQLQRVTERAPNSAGAQLAAEISACRRRLDELATLTDLTEEVEEAERLWKKAEETLRLAVEKLPDTGEANLEGLVVQLGKIDAAIHEAQSEVERKRAIHAVITGGKNEDELSAELDMLCDDLGVVPSYVRSQCESVQRELEALVKVERDANGRATVARETLKRHQELVDKLFADIATSDGFSWLRLAMPEEAAVQGRDLETQLRALERIAGRLESFTQVVERTRLGVQGVGSALRMLARRLDGKNGASSQDPMYGKAASHWLSNEVRQWFDDDIMRSALFSGGTDPHLELEDLTLVWSREGEIERRALAAFSSGQQAFAHTRAQLVRLERQQDQPANRLIALDEFGTTLDRDSLVSLLKDLTNRRERRPNDQVLLIVPAGFPSDIGNRGTTSGSRDEQLEEHGYFTEALYA